MTGGGIERIRGASAALTGRSSIRRSVKTDRHERFSAQRKGSVFSECRPLQRSGGGRRVARVALQTPLGLRSSLRSIAPIWPLRLSPPLERQDASGDEPVDASLQRAGAAIGAVARLRRGYGRRLMAPCGHPIHH